MSKDNIPRSFSFGSIDRGPQKSPSAFSGTSSPFVPRRVEDVANPPRRNSSIATHHGNSPLSPRIHPAAPSSPSRPPLLADAGSKQTQNRDPRTLLKAVTTLVKTRSGSVLSRNTILKMDHFPRASNTKLDFHLQGAPNFRSAKLDVYGVAQPSVIGLSTVLALLNCHPESLKEDSCTWFLTREEPLIYLNGHPYVLRDYADPMQNMGAFLGINAERLEEAEERLKKDVIKEAKSLGGLLLVHQELDDSSIVPCYLAADCVQTPREVFKEFQEKGFRLKYFRIPISPMQSPEDNYFDEYVRVIKTLKPTDPLIFNCGMGGVRTTVGMIIAQIIRRTQLIESGHADPFRIPGYNYSFAEGQHTSMSPEMIRGLGEIDSVHVQNRALLRLVHVLEMGLDSKMSSRSAIEWTLERGSLIANLKEAIMGNYQSIVSLTAALDNGTYCKRMLDEIIDRSDAVVNIREDILMNRIRQTTKSSSEHGEKNKHLFTALAGLERYFFLLCFTSYINGSADTTFETRFSSWVKERTEVWLMLRNMRNKGPRFDLFRPVDDLRTLDTNRKDSTSVPNYRRGSLGMFEMVGAGAQSGNVAGEVEEYILQARTGVVLTSQTILKIDFWRHSQLDTHDNEEMKALSTPGTPRESESTDSDSSYKALDQGPQMHHTFFIDGAFNFRRIKHTHIYGVAQPTIDGLRKAIRRLLTDQQRPNGKILWINLREEPIIYINGIPYVLRDRYFSLRNIRAYKGITGNRLEQIEMRLKQDVLREVHNYDGWIMLHGEDKDGKVQAAWEEVAVEDILTVREVMDLVAKEGYEELDNGADKSSASKGSSLDYHRVPITAEKTPQLDDFDELRQLIVQVNLFNTAVILNCQVGVGRSTIGTVIATLLTRWITSAANISQSSESLRSVSNKQPKYLNYQIINSLLRVIKNGLENKCAVDETVDKCGAFLNLRDVIESSHVLAENETDEEARRRIVKRGVISLERYFLLICFQAYLDSTSPDILEKTESFAKWMGRHPEMKTLLLDLRRDDLRLLVPVDQSMGDGVALSSEVMAVVNSRHGQVLGQQTILKHDAFPGCQKIGLKEKIDGAYNYRRVEIKAVKRAAMYGGLAASESGLAAELKQGEQEIPDPPFICGCAMPSKDGIRAVLQTMGAGPGGKRKVLWTCLREEPVLYVNKQPYVLRLFSDPVKNLETTGIAKERVEEMEERMKSDVLQELAAYRGRLLLHDEETDDKGGFPLVANWETVPVECVETPKEVFQSIVKEGYQVDYLRIPITDEQAPIPDVFDLLISRMSSASADVERSDESIDVPSEGVDVLFNCQMGRGRTTTGMVTACLMSMILNNDTEVDMSGSFIADTSGSSQRDLYDGDNDESHEERERYQNGDYKIILQLVSVLKYGKLAKRLTDQAINMCDHMQNLRKAVYDYKLRLESIEDSRAPKWRATQEAALNYLVRYFYLIVFANYLLEDKVVTEDEPSRTPTFKSWLRNRREITNIIKLQTVDLC